MFRRQLKKTTLFLDVKSVSLKPRKVFAKSKDLPLGTKVIIRWRNSVPWGSIDKKSRKEVHTLEIKFGRMTVSDSDNNIVRNATGATCGCGEPALERTGHIDCVDGAITHYICKNCGNKITAFCKRSEEDRAMWNNRGKLYESTLFI